VRLRSLRRASGENDNAEPGVPAGRCIGMKRAFLAILVGLLVGCSDGPEVVEEPTSTTVVSLVSTTTQAPVTTTTALPPSTDPVGEEAWSAVEAQRHVTDFLAALAAGAYEQAAWPAEDNGVSFSGQAQGEIARTSGITRPPAESQMGTWADGIRNASQPLLHRRDPELGAFSQLLGCRCLWRQPSTRTGGMRTVTGKNRVGQPVFMISTTRSAAKEVAETHNSLTSRIPRATPSAMSSRSPWQASGRPPSVVGAPARHQRGCLRSRRSSREKQRIRCRPDAVVDHCSENRARGVDRGGLPICSLCVQNCEIGAFFSRGCRRTGSSILGLCWRR
jgi:hypothetical protein